MAPAASSTLTFMRARRVWRPRSLRIACAMLCVVAFGAAFANTQDFGSFVPRIQPSAKR